jgi:predicted RNase H-like HicB family nuclease
MSMATRHYTAIAEPTPAGLSIDFPAFPGTVTTGETLAVALQ